MAMCIEMVEHDIPHEEREREPVLEEPHKKKEEKEKEKEEDGEGEEGSEGAGENKPEEDQPSQPSSEAATTAAEGYAGVSTFFSGIASMVQTTVSSE